MSEKKHVIIVGGGAAGMIAAISAKRLETNVTILERNPRVGKKILATGNGRCNFTNINSDITYFHGNNPKFAYSAFSNFTMEETIKFFEKLGIQPKIEDFGKVFPMSDQASSVLDVLRYELDELGVNTICDAFVKNIKKRNNKFFINLEDGSTHKADKVIIATGGKAMPSSGSDGNGYDLAINQGHKITDIFPALVQLMVEGNFLKRIDGVKFVGTAEIIHKNKSIEKDSGDILFTNYGVSGPPILQISRQAGEYLQSKKDVYLKISIIDTMAKDDLIKILKKRFKLSSSKSLEFSLVGLINKKLIPVILMEAGIKDLKSSAEKISDKEIDNIAHILTDWRFKIKATKSWSSAQVTAGGVDTKEINNKTMESKLIEGLFFAGEIIDIDGYCGGFNLQWAWSSGFVAGRNAALL